MEKKNIVSINNLDAIEVRENNRLAPRYGMNNISFQATREKEQEVIRKCEEILEKKELPLLVRKLGEFAANAEQEEVQDVFIVLAKAKDFLKEGFHVLIVNGMLGCAGGNKSNLGYGCFDEKFGKANTDMDFRKELWGTKHLLPIDMVRFVLLDLMNSIKLDDVHEENISKSELVSWYVSNYADKKDVAEFAKFCA